MLECYEHAQQHMQTRGYNKVYGIIIMTQETRTNGTYHSNKADRPVSGLSVPPASVSI